MAFPQALDSITGSAFAPVSEPLFHYTDSDGLLGIVRDRRLWASEAASLNDRAEVRQGWAAIRSLVPGLADVQGRNVLKSFLQVERDSDPHDVFVLCASFSGDDANQWRLYGNGGRGYAVEVDPSVALVVTTTATPRAQTKSRIPWADVVGNTTVVTRWLRVLYSVAEVKEALEDLNHYAADGEDWIAAQNAETQEKDFLYESLGEQITEGLGVIAHLYKTEGFIGEREARLVSSIGLRGTAHVRFRSGAYGLRSYVALANATAARDRVHFEKDAEDRPVHFEPLPLRSIRLGPLLDPDSQATVVKLLRQQGQPTVGVTTSEVPLR